MSTCESIGNKSIQDLVREGSLYDITPHAKKFEIRRPTFLAKALWEGAFMRRDEKLDRALTILADYYEFLAGWDHYGPNDFGTFTCSLEYAEELGQVMVFFELQGEDALGLNRVVGDRMQYFA